MCSQSHCLSYTYNTYHTLSNPSTNGTCYLCSQHVHTSNHRSITNHQNSTYKPSAATNAAGFPLLAIAIACITAITLLIVSYFLITKCCYPLARFLMTRTTPSSDEPPSIYSTPAWQITGLDESLIQQIPVCRYSKRDGDNIRLYKCVVCLNEFQDSDTLRVLPSCDHGFHLHCIDIWLRNNPNCPICRLNISGGAPNPDTIVMTSSPQHPPSLAHNSPTTSDEEFVTIELGDYWCESQKCRIDPIVSDKRVSVAKDEELVIQPLRRSFRWILRLIVTFTYRFKTSYETTKKRTGETTFFLVRTYARITKRYPSSRVVIR